MTNRRFPRPGALELNLEGASRAKELRRLRGVLVGALSLTWSASRSGFLRAAALQIVGALSLAALVLVGQLALRFLLEPGGSRGLTGGGLIVLLALVTALGSMAATLQQQQQRVLGEEVGVAVWRRVLDVTGRIELEYFESPRFYDQFERVRTNAVIRPPTVTTAVFGLIGGVIGTGGLLVVLLAIDPLLVPVLLLAGVPAILLARRVSALEFRFVSAAAPLVRARDYLRIVLTGREEAKEIRAFGSGPALRSRHDLRSEEVLTALRSHVRTRQRYALVGVGGTTLALAASLAMLVWFLSIGRIGIADAGAAALGIRLLSSRLDQTFQSVAGLLESSVFLDDLDDFLGLGGRPRTAPAVTAPRDTAEPDVFTGPSLRSRIDVRGLRYTYPGSTVPAVDGVDLSIGAGEVIALVGDNGSGKTTLAKLVAGLYTPDSGDVEWDGLNVLRWDPAEVRSRVSVIFQDFVRYQLPAWDNIGLGDPERLLDRAAIVEAAQRAGASRFLDRLPDGYDTILSKEYIGGTDLSVGQWQRMALARGLLRDSPLVVLDEPSSALDPRAEQELFADVRNVISGRAALLISHRYSTVRSADRIYVMQNGRIQEAGSHEALMSQNGLYAELFTLQARAYS